MKLEINKYRRTLDATKPILLRTEMEPHMRCTILALATEVPLLAVVLYALRPEVIGEDAELRQLVETLTKFYRYSVVETWTDMPPLPDQPPLPLPVAV